MSSLSELRQILKEDVHGKNLYDHLVQVLMKIFQDRPNNVYEIFEQISSEMKSNPFDPNPNKGRSIPKSSEEINSQVTWTNTNTVLLKVPEEAPEEPEVKVQNILNDFSILEWASISLSKGEVYRLFLSMKALAITLPNEVEKIRFFGKITTRSKPYYVVEGLSPDDSFDDSNDENLFEGKSGVNKYSYWVTQRVDAANGWIRLPHVFSHQIVTARLIRRLLTGDINSLMPTYPIFDGTEKNYLRAIIAIIGGSTVISPDGYFELDDSEDPPVAKPAEQETINETFPKSANELKDPDSWRHHELEVNILGRVTALPEQLDENGEVVEPEVEIEITPPLNSLNPEDWTFRISPGGSGQIGESIVVARSLKYPGAVAAAIDRKYINIYIGNGLPFNAKAYTPPLPLQLCVEYTTSIEEDSEVPNWQTLKESEDKTFDPTPPKPENDDEEED